MGKRELLDIDSAADIVLSDARPLDPGPVPLRDAGGRFAACRVVSKVDLPGFDNSVMDGFAVVAADTVGAGQMAPVTLEVVGESRAGQPFSGPVRPGQAIAISTGAMLPDGADAILQKEIVELSGTQITVSTGVEPGHDIRFMGEVVRAGDEVLAAGTALGAVELGALASTGHDPVSCVRLPRVSLLTSGDELVEPGSPLGSGQIWNSNGLAISELISESGAEQVAHGSVTDDLEATIEALDDALGADLTVICGGVSVGDHDHVRPALAELGVEQLFWGLALKPGRPTWFGRRGNAAVLGLPGNPVSAFVVFRLLALPLLKVLGGGPGPTPRPTGRLVSPVERLPERLHAVPCRPAGPDRLDELVPMPQLGSHDFLSLLGATRLALIEPGTGRAEAGDMVETVSLGGV